MKVPLTWLKEFIDIDGIPLEELAHRLTLAGLEVEEIRYVGLPVPDPAGKGTHRRETKTTGFGWDPEKIVVGAVLEVLPHPDADRLVLCRLDDGQEIHTVLTGAPNLFPYLGKGELDPPLKVAYAREGARIVDAYTETRDTRYTTIQRKEIRGVESYSMACSEKELGISDRHEGIIILDRDAPTGQPLVEYMGDAVLDIAITPNIARAASIMGVAREVAALTGRPVREPSLDVLCEGPSIEGRVSLEITEPELNPRFVLGLIEDARIEPSPYWVQRRLRLAGVRPIDNIVDATNYVLLEIGEPLHAFDYDVLLERADGESPRIITRTAHPGEQLTTLDDVQRTLDDFTVLVTDTQGPLSIAGVMGGAESEVSEGTRNVLLEGASWNYINIRRTVAAQRLPSEAAYRFERGVHPSLASRGVLRCLELMRRWSGGKVASGLVDEYPLPPEIPTVWITTSDVRRWLGIDLTLENIAELLERLDFTVEVRKDHLEASPPDYRLDIGEGVIGLADLLEEIARIYGYDRIPETRMADELPYQRNNLALEVEERIRDILVGLGLQEIITYRLTEPGNEARHLPEGEVDHERSYVTLANPITTDRTVMRRSVLASVLETIEANNRVRERMALFEIGPRYFPAEEEGMLPREENRLVIAVTGPRNRMSWQGADLEEMDFYDLKGMVQALLDALHLDHARFIRDSEVGYHPGKFARVMVGQREIGGMGEIHPLVCENYDFPSSAVIAADFSLRALIDSSSELFEVRPIPNQPPVYEDLAVVVPEELPGAEVDALIRQTAGEILADLHLFDIYRGEQVGKGKKSLAYSLVYQHPERTLTDKEVAKVRKSIIYRLEKELGGKLRE